MQTETLEEFMKRGGAVKKLSIVETGVYWTGYRKKNKQGKRILDSSLNAQNKTVTIKNKRV
jgi:hypothetical protein